jgi:hypothetical protein
MMDVATWQSMGNICKSVFSRFHRECASIGVPLSVKVIARENGELMIAICLIAMMVIITKAELPKQFVNHVDEKMK